jgi:DNA-directed RNA polymerase beta subunit
MELEKILNLKQTVKNIRFTNSSESSAVNVFIIQDDSDTGKSSPFNTWLTGVPKGMVEQAIIPPVITILGKRLANLKYFQQQRKSHQEWNWSKVIRKQKDIKKNNIIDMSGISNEIIKLSKTRSQKSTFEHVLRTIDKIILDLKHGKNILLIPGSDSLVSDFILYNVQLMTNKVHSSLDGVVAYFNDTYYPLAHKNGQSLVFNKNMMTLLENNKEEIRKGKKLSKIVNGEVIIPGSSKNTNSGISIIGLEAVKAYRKKIETALKGKNSKSDLQNIFNEPLVINNKEVESIDKKLNILFNDPELEKIIKDILSIDTKSVDNIKNNSIGSDVKEQNITVSLPRTGTNKIFNREEIVGLKTLPLNRHKYELNEKMDKLIEKLVYDVIQDDPETDIEIMDISTKIVDNYKSRYREYKVKIKHSKLGRTTDKPYSITFRTPVLLNDRYVKIGGNQYVMISQLFSKPIQKVNNSMVRLYTHYGVASVSLKNSALTNKTYKELEEQIIAANSAIAVTVQYADSEFKQKLENSIGNNCKNLREEINSIVFSKIHIKSHDKKHLYKIDFQKARFLEVQNILSKDVAEYAYFKGDYIIYKDKEHDVKEYPISNLNEFLFNIYVKAIPSLLKKSKTSRLYLETRILGENVPTSVLILINNMKDVQKAMKIMKLEYALSDKKDNDAVNIILRGSDSKTYLHLYPKTNLQEYFANGLVRFKVKNSGASLEEYAEALFNTLELKAGKKAHNLLTVSDRFIDRTSKDILKEEGYHTTLSEVMGIDMADLISKKLISSQYDLENYRVRMGEVVTALAYKQLQKAMTTLKDQKELTGAKLYMDNTYILDNLIDSGILQYTKTLNPLEELMLSTKITKAGLGNAKKDMMSLNRRDLNPSYFGSIGPISTNEYGGIGINQTLTNGVKINKTGGITKKAFSNDSNSFENLSVVESLTPFFEYDDTTRRVMGAQQTGQFVELDNPDIPLVQTGFEAYIPQIVSDRFAKKAKIDSVVTKIDKGIIYLTEKRSGNKYTIDATMVKSRTKRGIYVGTNYTVLCKIGQNVKAGDIVAASNSLKNNKLAIGRNVVVALNGYMGMNYEDGWAITNSIKNKFKSSYLQKITIPVNVNDNITSININREQDTKTGDILISYKTEYKNEIYESNNKDDDHQDDINSLETRGNVNIFRSPGGVIKDVVVKMNVKHVQKEIKKLHKESVASIEKRLEECEAGNHIDIKHYDCLGSIENIETMSIGGFKINDMEIEGSIIEVYIEQDNIVRNGSKFTLANSGGKGTVQYVIEQGLEPYGEETELKIELMGTPIGIISRKNPSILLNMYLGKVIYFLNKAVKVLASNSKTVAIKNLVTQTFSFIDKTQDQMLLKQLDDFFKMNNNDIIKIINASDPLSNPAFPAIVPPFKNKINIKHIKEAANFLKIPLNEKIVIPENNGVTTEKTVPVGVLPVQMLEHFPEAMSSVRGILNVGRSSINNQGRSGTAEGKGAIKLGQYDLYSLLSRNPGKLIKELHSLRSDATKGKQTMIKEILKTNRPPDVDDIELTDDDFSSRDMVYVYFIGAGLEPSFGKEKGKE